MGQHQRPPDPEPKIREAVANYLVDQLYENVDVEKELRKSFPATPKNWPGPVSGGLRQVAGERGRKGAGNLDRPGTLEERQQDAHEQLIEVLEEKEGTLSTEEGKVSLNLGSLVTNLADQVGIGATWPKSCRRTPARSRSCAPTS